MFTAALIILLVVVGYLWVRLSFKTRWQTHRLILILLGGAVGFTAALLWSGNKPPADRLITSAINSVFFMSSWILLTMAGVFDNGKKFPLGYQFELSFQGEGTYCGPKGQLEFQF